MQTQEKIKKIGMAFESLVQVVAQLRHPTQGCPWDLEQTHDTLAKYAIEEAAELAEVIALGSQSPHYEKHLKEELGDLLFQPLLQAQLAEDRQSFDIEDVILGIKEKLIRRHPHVFAQQTVSGTQEVIHNWAEIKKQEKAQESGYDNSSTSGISHFPPIPPLPALQKAAKIGDKAKKLHFDWSSALDVWKKVEEELLELSVEVKKVDKMAMEDELGDVLFSLAQWSRHQGLDPELALQKANQKFISRFDLMLADCKSQNKNWDSLNDDEKQTLWTKVKGQTWT